MSDPSDLIEALATLLPDLTERALNAESGESSKRKDRAPYPSDEAWEILPPIDEKQSAMKRKAAEKEFWDVL